MEPIVTVEGLTVSFDGVDVTHEVSFDLLPGHITALVGESGSGKSVSAMALPRLDPSVASVRGSAILHTVQGAARDNVAEQSTTIDLLGDDAPLRTIRGGLIGTVFQEPSTAFDPIFTIGYQIREALQCHGQKIANAELKQRVLDQLREVGLSDAERIYKSYPHQLSGGQLQRAMIAMAIINRPNVLIADEPTTALDVTTQRAILDLLARLTKELSLAVLLITHDMGVVWQVADEVYVMYQGKLIEQGAVKELFRNPREEYTRRLLQAVPMLRTGSDVVHSVKDQALGSHSLHQQSCDGGESLAHQDRGGDHQEKGSDHQDVWQDDRDLLDFVHVTPTAYAQGSGAQPTSATIVDVSNLSVLYPRQAHHAVKDITIHIPAGQTHALVGESGAGKTTIAKALSGQLINVQGHITIAGQDLVSLKGKARRTLLSQLGYVFQDSGSALNPRKTIGWSIAEPMLVLSLIHI